MIVVLEVCAAVHATPAATLVTVTAVVMLTSTFMPVGLGALIGLSTWGFYTGFVTNVAGLLTFHPADLTRLTILVGVGTVAAVAGRRRRTVSHPVNSGGSPWPTWSSSR